MSTTCDACGGDLTGIFSKHYFGDWGLNPHCLSCGRKCDDAGLREAHEHSAVGVSAREEQ